MYNKFVIIYDIHIMKIILSLMFYNVLLVLLIYRTLMTDIMFYILCPYDLRCLRYNILIVLSVLPFILHKKCWNQTNKNIHSRITNIFLKTNPYHVKIKIWIKINIASLNFQRIFLRCSCVYVYIILEIMPYTLQTTIVHMIWIM